MNIIILANNYDPAAQGRREGGFRGVQEPPL